MRIYSFGAQKRAPTVKSNNPKTPRKNFRLFKKGFGWKRLFTWAFRLTALGILFIAILFLYYTKDLPDPNKLLDRQVPESTKIFDRNGGLLYEIHGEYKRTLITLDQVAPVLKNATIAIEDKDFYKHGGISYTGIARAVIVDILTGKKTQGGSTITQQFVKNAILTTNKSWDRKIRELILSVAMEQRFSKDQILQFYLNEIPYGRNAYGIEAAAQTYFNKPAKDLNLAESAYLAALPQSTTYYNPFGPHRDALDARKNTVINAMRDQNYITPDQAKAAKEEKVAFSPITTGIKAPHFVLWVQDYLANKYGDKTLESGGLKVYTTLDPKLQDIAEKAVKNGIDKESTKYNVHNAGLVAIDPKTGQILAMVGSKDYFGEVEPKGCAPGRSCLFEPNVNVALSQRQPGSSFKPYVYATAFKKEHGYAPASMLIDVTTNFGTYNGKDYVPGNYNGQSYGPLSIRQAMAGSLNIPAVKTLDLVGVDNAVQTARDLGITSPMADCGLSLVLGGCEVRLIDHVAAMSAIANGGVKNEKTPILKIIDKDNKILEEFKSSPREVLDARAAYEIISIMTDNDARSFIFGANSPLILPDRTVAAKTGTTNDWGDGWTVGFTPSLTTGVWTGNNCGGAKCPMKKGADGVVVAAPIWHEFMAEALKGAPAEDFAVPGGIQQITVDSTSGKLPTDASPATKTEVFADYAIPTTYDNVHLKVGMDSLTGQPANGNTPSDRIIYKTYTVLHSERPENPNWENPVVQWALAHGYQYPPSDAPILKPIVPGNKPNVEILNPSDGANISSLPFQVSVNAISSNSITKAELNIDGEPYQNLSASPFAFVVNKGLTNGSHTLAVKITDNLGQTADTSITVNVNLNLPLTLTEPNDQSLLVFPVTLTAESQTPYGSVSFYYQDAQGKNTLIGPAENTDHLGDTYRYTFNWQIAPPAGSYKIYATAGSGLITKKIRVSVP